MPATPITPDEAATSYRWAYTLLLGVATAVIVADQLSKAVVSNDLGRGRVIQLAGGRVFLDYTRNTGAAFSILKAGGGLFLVLAVVVSISIVAFYRRLASSPLPVRIGLGLVLGGAIGNLIDRVRLGYVVDFIDLRWWPVFNVADSAIVVGVALLIVTSFLPVHESSDA